MERDHRQSAARLQVLAGSVQHGRQGIQLAVDGDADGLKAALGRVLLFPEGLRRHGRFNYLHQLQGGLDGSGFPRPANAFCNSGSIALLTIFVEDPPQLLIGPAVDDLAGTQRRTAIHPHIQRRVMHVAEAALGKVFAAELYETRRPGLWCLTFDMTDYAGSVTVRKYMDEKEAKPLNGLINPGMWLRLQGIVELTRDGKDIQLRPLNIMKITHEGRRDTSPEKRVELHLHTRMSNMDALTDTASVIKQAVAWGHPAIAITDHGVVQSFPDAWHNAGKIKILYGVEGYFVNNLDDRVAVHGDLDQSFDEEIVCFDIETTGLKVATEAITEIGAVVLKNGQITDTFQTFVNPHRRLTPEIIGLTGITDAMLSDAPSLKEALTAFLKFVNGRPLAAHNAPFDISFIRAGCEKVGLDFDPTYIDSLILAQNLLPELHKYKLDIVAEHLDLPAFNHHRASDDAGMVGYMLVPFFEKMRSELHINRIQQINQEMLKLRPQGGKSNRFPKHIIILAKNKLGLKHLYQLISASNLKYFHRVPTIPKTELAAHREGLIIGSACEAGELFRAVSEHREWAELKRIAAFYDYLEIQPICNNMFMLRNGDVQSEEELREFNRTIVRLGEELGKPVGSDASNEKTTYVSLLGLDEVRRLAQEHTDAAVSALKTFKRDTADLRLLADRLLARSL